MSEHSLSDEAIALTDAIKTVIEVVLATGIATPRVFDQMYGHQRDGKLAKKDVKGAAIMEMLRQFSVDPTRAAYRESIRTLLREQPKGTA